MSTTSKILLGKEYIISSKEKWSQRGESGEWDRIVDDPNSYVNIDNAHHLFGERLIDLVKDVNPEAKVLDIGCGTGNATKYIRPFVDDSRIIGIDVAEGMIKKAKEKYPRIDWRVMECLDMPFEKELFAIIFARAVMPSHLGAEYWRKVCQECHELLKGGGYLVFDYLSSNYNGEQPDNKVIYDTVAIKGVFEESGYSEQKLLDVHNKNAIVLLRK